MVGECKHCGTEFEARKGKIYCSTSCRKKAHNERKRITETSYNPYSERGTERTDGTERTNLNGSNTGRSQRLDLLTLAMNEKDSKVVMAIENERLRNTVRNMSQQLIEMNDRLIQLENEMIDNEDRINSIELPEEKEQDIMERAGELMIQIAGTPLGEGIGKAIANITAKKD